jgi:hypothetical protein
VTSETLIRVDGAMKQEYQHFDFNGSHMPIAELLKDQVQKAFQRCPFVARM